MSKESKDNVYIHKNTYFINGTFNDEMRSAVVWNLEKHISELKDQKNAKLTFYISSHGGEAYLLLDLVELFEQAKKHDIIIRTIVTSHAYSAGSMLAIAGTKGERYIGEYAEHLVHYGQFDGYRKTTPLQIDRTSQHFKRWTNTMIAHYNKYSDIPEIEDKLRDDDFYITAKDSIKWGLADKYTSELDI